MKYICPKCWVAVVDTKRHAKWHEKDRPLQGYIGEAGRPGPPGPMGPMGPPGRDAV